MSSRVQKLLLWVVSLENQHALCEDPAAKHNACALDFGDPKRKHKHAEFGTNDVASLLLGILAQDKMSYKSFLKSQAGIISLGAFQVFCEARANTRSLWSNRFTTAEIDV